ncbi:unnamed protein product [Penicillium palitans]
MEVESGYKLVVAVDYGTTFTAIAFAIKSNAVGQADTDSIRLITRWPPGVTSGFDTPSLISYTHNGEPPLWGYQVEPGMQSYAWTKLLLDRNIQHGDFDDEMLRVVTGSKILQLPDQKEAVDTVADYLSQIYGHIQYHLPRVVELPRGCGGDPSGVPIDFCFTTPASWSEQTRSLMRVDWNGAEAAALAVFSDKDFNLQSHDVLICDCGGGKVDITTYYVTDVVLTISIEQITAAMGAKCGGTAIDSRFYEFVSSRLEG